ncbi:MAG: aldo/keto reductase [Archangium sp.]|nr:aldo/keto reductase [Archangium sp.]
MGLGLAALGRPGYMTVGHAADVVDGSEAGMQRTAFAVLDEAWRLGVRHFDTARSYGQGEAFLGAWLAARGHRGATVSSKWGYRYTANWQRTADVHEVKEHTLAHFEAQWPQSRQLLGEALRVYQIHSVTPDSPALVDAALHDRLARLRDSGVVVGASVSGARQAELIDALLRLERGGARLFGSVQATWNVLERSAGPALQAARDAGLLVIVKEGLANGRLSPRGDVQPLKEEAAKLGVTADVVALAVVLAQPFADVVLSGAATMTQVASNLAAAQLPVAPDSLVELTVSPETYWAQRATLKWT